MRPASIQWFERIYFATLAIGAVNLLVHYRTLGAVMGNAGGTMAIVFTSFFAGIAISLMFWYLVARRASTIATDRLGQDEVDPVTREDKA